MIQGNVFVKRESGDEGTVALVITDGHQTVGYFLKANHLPMVKYKQIRVGGNFENNTGLRAACVVPHFGIKRKTGNPLRADDSCS